MNEKRFEPHLFDDGVNEKYFDGIIDNKDDSDIIRNYGYISNLLNNLSYENEQLKNELKEFKDYVYSDEKILCYSCVNCLKKGIYEVECSEKGKVDVHGSCFLYWKNEVKE